MTRCCDIDPIVFGHICWRGRPKPRPPVHCLPSDTLTDGDQLAQLDHEIRSHHMAQIAERHAAQRQHVISRMIERLAR